MYCVICDIGIYDVVTDEYTFVRMMLLPTNIHIPDTEYYAFVDEYLYLQSTAMKQAQPVSFDIYNVRFNQKGNVNQAKTIYFQNNRSIVVELGGGRLATQ